MTDDVIDAIPIGTSPEHAMPMNAIPVEELESVEASVGTTPVQPKPHGVIINAIPVEREPVQSFQADPLMQIPAELLAPQPSHNAPTNQSRTRGPSLAVSPLMNSQRPKRRSRRSRAMSLDSPAGPIWSLVLSIVGIPMLIWVIWRFAQHANGAYELMRLTRLAGSGFEQTSGGSTFSFVVLVMLCLMFVALAISMAVSAAVSIIEMSQGIRLGWATKVAAIGGSVVLVSLLLTCGWHIINLLRLANTTNALGDQLGTSNVGLATAKLIGWYCLYAIVPAATVVTGFCRNLK